MSWYTFHRLPTKIYVRVLRSEGLMCVLILAIFIRWSRLSKTKELSEEIHTRHNLEVRLELYVYVFMCAFIEEIITEFFFKLNKHRQTRPSVIEVLDQKSIPTVPLFCW